MQRARPRPEAAAAAALALLAACAAWPELDAIVTWSSGPEWSFWRQEALKMAAGHGRWGLAEHLHFPPGPAYLMLPLIFAGVDTPRVFGLVGLTLCTLAYAMLLRELLAGVPGRAKLVAAGAAFWVATQPVVLKASVVLSRVSLGWALSLGILALAVRARRPRRALAVLGFVLGWVTYDNVFAVGCGVFTVRLLRGSGGGAPDGIALRRAARECAPLAAGFAAAVALHGLQVLLFLGDVALWAREAAGMLLANLGFLGAADAVDPRYLESLLGAEELFGFIPGRWDMVVHIAGQWPAIPGRPPHFAAWLMLAAIAAAPSAWGRPGLGARARALRVFAVAAGAALGALGYLLVFPLSAAGHWGYSVVHYCYAVLVALAAWAAGRARAAD